MDRESIEFWNGALKCAIKMERKARECSNIDQLREEISYMRQRIEDVHIQDPVEVLNMIEEEKVID
ncbi:MAG: DUF4071 domain-containing protein [Thermoplasmatales archaeon]|nr:DUF4071 domain-containing protein [Thermoplasmatales archaeon]